MSICTPQLQMQNVPELLHHIQSLLPPEEATRTCVLSKLWLHAWSTIPTLRFTKPLDTQHQQQLPHEADDKYIGLINHTLVRYRRDNIPLQSLDLLLSIENQSSLSLLEVWIPLISSKSSCLKELSLRIRVKNIMAVTLPEEIFAGELLNMISIKIDDESNPLSISQHPVIKCLSLRVLELELVDISEEVLDNLFSTCKLLEKINLVFSIGFLGTIKIKNLRYLRELRLKFEGKHDILEVDGVPCLALFHYDSGFNHRMHPFPFHMNVLESVKELCFGGAVANNSLLDMLISKFPFLESLDLILGRWSHKSFVITCDSLKRLTLQFFDNRRIRIQVDAPKLLYFCYVGDKAPTLLFPVIVPKQIKLRIMMNDRYPVDVSSFLKIREALDLPSVFDIDVLDERWSISEPLNIDVDNLRRRVTLPAMSVQQLSLKIRLSNQLWDFSSFFGAFFSICHPSYVKLYQDEPFEDKNSVYMLLVKELIENESTKRYWSNLKDVKIINPHGKSNSVDFQLNW